MHTDDHNKLDPSVLAEMGYEKRDLDISAIGKVALWFGVFTLGSVFLSFAFFKIPGVVPTETVGRPITKIAAPVGTPIIQNNSNNTEDIAELRQKEQAVLDGSGPSAKDPGFYHIPVAQAMAMIEKRGLPTSAVDEPAPAVPARGATPVRPVGARSAVPAGGPALGGPGTKPEPATQVPGQPRGGPKL